MQRTEKSTPFHIQVQDYYSYEHFYVIYCKFWELDTDRDLILSRDDLFRYDDHSLTRIAIDRVFSHAPRPLNPGNPDTMTYENFVYFFLSEKDKTNYISLSYWFTVVNIHGDGELRPDEMLEVLFLC